MSYERTTILRRHYFSDQDYYTACLNPDFDDPNLDPKAGSVGLAELMPDELDGFSRQFGTFEITVKFTPDE